MIGGFDSASLFFSEDGKFRKYLSSHGLSDNEMRHVENKIRNAARGLDCIDNFRCYCISGVIRSIKTSREIKSYHKAKKNGCCGFYDEQVKLKSGKTFVFGFNYGH